MAFEKLHIGNEEVVGATLMAPVVGMVNVANESTSNDGRHQCGPYDLLVPDDGHYTTL